MQLPASATPPSHPRPVEAQTSGRFNAKTHVYALQLLFKHILSLIALQVLASPAHSQLGMVGIWAVPLTDTLHAACPPHYDLTCALLAQAYHEPSRTLSFQVHWRCCHRQISPSQPSPKTQQLFGSCRCMHRQGNKLLSKLTRLCISGRSAGIRLEPGSKPHASWATMLREGCQPTCY